MKSTVFSLIVLAVALSARVCAQESSETIEGGKIRVNAQFSEGIGKSSPQDRGSVYAGAEKSHREQLTVARTTAKGTADIPKPLKAEESLSRWDHAARGTKDCKGSQHPVVATIVTTVGAVIGGVAGGVIASPGVVSVPIGAALGTSLGAAAGVAGVLLATEPVCAVYHYGQAALDLNYKN